MIITTRVSDGPCGCVLGWWVGGAHSLSLIVRYRQARAYIPVKSNNAGMGGLQIKRARERESAHAYVHAPDGLIW